MRISPFCRRTILVLLTLFFATCFCYADHKSVQVIGTTECSDCQLKNIKHSDAFKGLKVSINCKLTNGEVKTRGQGKLDEEGKFSVNIPHDLLQDGKKLKEECYAQLHGSSNLPCPSHNGLESTKLAFVSKTNEKHTFSPVKNLKFSPETCTSEFFWPFFKHPWFKKPYSKPEYKKPITDTPSVPVYKDPSYAPPVYKKPSYYPPVHKKPITDTPSVPVYKKPSYYSPPVYKKPADPPVYKKPADPPVYKKPITDTPSVPVYKKPCPDIPIPKIDPKVFIHPKFKKWPVFPPKP